MVNNLGQLMELKKETSSAYLSAARMVMQKVQLMESDWVHPTELCSETQIQMVPSSVCLSAEPTVMQMVQMLDSPMVMSLVCPLAEWMAMQKELQMAHLRP
jgi:hypothetical protein